MYFWRMVFSVGDRVHFLNEAGEGVITSISGDTAMVEVDGFDMPYLLSDLIAIDGSTTKFVTKEHELKEDRDKSVFTLKKRMNPTLKGAMADIFKRVNAKGIPEIDLHVHELAEDYSGLRPHEIQELQLEFLKYAISQAEEHTVRELIIIHGVGEGVLKREVHALLDAMRFIERNDASYSLYGYGATHIRLRGLTG